MIEVMTHLFTLLPNANIRIARTAIPNKASSEVKISAVWVRGAMRANPIVAKVAIL